MSTAIATLDVSFLEQALQDAKEQAKALVSAKRACISILPKDLAINGRQGAAKTFVNCEIWLRIGCLNNESEGCHRCGRLEQYQSPC